eukprot:CAMPEP_0180785644 /NCGR_PEP_ID=MMETSP1038_2-20121128/50327_1 /TAXON_ID=632150 /ORGANISM="Azadinium spinosum, Strain 3D9" /LENGTH=75 /DNA_ID=CAMNT_0022822613 /DNA_START=360 /DNA_END=584 /DNA_ORIENTATION=-
MALIIAPLLTIEKIPKQGTLSGKRRRLRPPSQCLKVKTDRCSVLHEWRDTEPKLQEVDMQVTWFSWRSSHHYGSH